MPESLNKSVKIEDFIPVMKEQLDNGKKVSFVPHGNSMRPMLHDGTDLVILKKPTERLHLFDVALYYRKETEKYVVHRVVGFQKDGCYVMLGDNNFQKEYNISHDDVVGVVTAFYRKGRMYEVDHPIYRLYNNFWYYTRPVRLLFCKIKGKLGSK